MKIYTYPKFCEKDYLLFRFGGPGLGNLLFPWARSVKVAHEHNLNQIWATWPQLKIGPILRNEIDKRAYSDLFRPVEGYVTGIKKLYLFNNLFTKKISENEYYKIYIENQELSNINTIVTFSGMKDMFTPIQKSHELIKGELKRITMPIHLEFNKSEMMRSISLHIRMGDFKIYDESRVSKEVTNMRLPLEWYIDIVKKINYASGNAILVKVFSDASDEELLELLKIDNVERVRSGSAISDIFAISHSKALVASNSTFSMWAAYLGRMPLIRFKGMGNYNIFYNKSEHEIELGLNESIPAAFLNHLLGDI